jgi:hypothetical protein
MEFFVLKIKKEFFIKEKEPMGTFGWLRSHERLEIDCGS